MPRAGRFAGTASHPPPCAAAAGQAMVLSPWKMRLFATALGLLVANLYYLLPMLPRTAASFGVAITSAGYLVTCTQLGYALGVLLLVPLGDIRSRRALAGWMLAVDTVGLPVCAASPDFWILAAGTVLVGISSSAAMVVVPYIAEHAPANRRGRLVGQAMTGLLLGILLARTASGLIADLLGWRWMFVLAAVACGLLQWGLRWAMQPAPAEIDIRYGRLLASLWPLLKQEPELRLRGLYALLGMASFSVFWTGLTFLLSGRPYHYTPASIGLFGLIGAAGALSANLAGRCTDRGHAQAMTGWLAGLMVLAWACLACGRSSLTALIIGVVVLDIAAQGLQVSHQSVIYALAPQARSRVTAIFVTCAFIGMAAGSAVASSSYRAGGWLGLSALGAALPTALLIVWGWSRRRSAPPNPHT